MTRSIAGWRWPSWRRDRVETDGYPHRDPEIGPLELDLRKLADSPTRVGSNAVQLREFVESPILDASWVARYVAALGRDESLAEDTQGLDLSETEASAMLLHATQRAESDVDLPGHIVRRAFDELLAKARTVGTLKVGSCGRPWGAVLARQTDSEGHIASAM